MESVVVVLPVAVYCPGLAAADLGHDHCPADYVGSYHPCPGHFDDHGGLCVGCFRNYWSPAASFDSTAWGKRQNMAQAVQSLGEEQVVGMCLVEVEALGAKMNHSQPGAGSFAAAAQKVVVDRGSLEEVDLCMEGLVAADRVCHTLPEAVVVVGMRLDDHMLVEAEAVGRVQVGIDCILEVGRQWEAWEGALVDMLQLHEDKEVGKMVVAAVVVHVCDLAECMILAAAAGCCMGLEEEPLVQEEDKDRPVPKHLLAGEGTEAAMEAVVRIWLRQDLPSISNHHGLCCHCLTCFSLPVVGERRQHHCGRVSEMNPR